MRLYFTFLLLLIFYCVSGQKKYYYHGNETVLNNSRYNRHSIMMDESYTLYIRTIHRDTSKGKNELLLNQPLNDTAGKPLIEVGYLLFSRAQGRCLYISCMLDKYEGYYSNNWLGPVFLNLYDVQLLDFGRIQGNSIVYEPKKGYDIQDIWTINETFNEIEVVAIQENDLSKNNSKIFAIQSLLGKRSIFQKAPSYSIVFKGNNKPKKGSTQTTKLLYLKDSAIHVLEDKISGKFITFFNLDGEVGKASRFVFDGVFFLDNRLTYSPLQLFSRK